MGLVPNSGLMPPAGATAGEAGMAGSLPEPGNDHGSRKGLPFGGRLRALGRLKQADEFADLGETIPEKQRNVRPAYRQHGGQ